MAPRTLASLAHALGAAPTLDAALVALGEGLAELDRTAHLALLRYDARRDLLREAVVPREATVARTNVETAFDHLPVPLRRQLAAGGTFVDTGDDAADFARLLTLPSIPEGGQLALRGILFEGSLCAVLALYETRKIFGTRTSERFAPSVALFELAFARFAESDAREEAVRTLEDVTQRVHGEYLKKLAILEDRLRQQRDVITTGSNTSARVLQLEQELARTAEDLRRAVRRAEAVEHQVSAAVGQLEQLHVELHRRSEAVRQKSRSLYLIDRVLTMDARMNDPRQLADGLLALVGDDMQAQRCSLMLRAPEPNAIYLAAGRGLPPHMTEGVRIRFGEGVAGKVAASREPLLVQDVSEAQTHPLLHDQYFTTGSFISFPLTYHGQLIGVLNMTNRALRGIYTDEDVERVRLLALVISLVAVHAKLPERLSVPVPTGAA